MAPSGGRCALCARALARPGAHARGAPRPRAPRAAMGVPVAATRRRPRAGTHGRAHGAHPSPWRDSRAARHPGAVRERPAGGAPPWHGPAEPRTCRVVSERPSPQRRVERGTEAGEGERQDPGAAPAARLGTPQGLSGRRARAGPRRVRLHRRLAHRCQRPGDHRLGQALRPGGHPAPPLTALTRGARHRPPRGRTGTARREARPALREVRRPVRLQGRARCVLETRCPLLRLHPLRGMPPQPCGPPARLGGLPWCLPCLVDPHASCTLPPLRSTPMTEGATRRRGVPPRCPTWGRSRWWGCHGRGARGSRATGAHGPPTSRAHRHALGMPDAAQAGSR
jgi:hypothetical protein